GFLEGVNHQRLVHGRFPKSRGVHVGTVAEIRKGKVTVELAAEHQATHSLEAVIKPGDGVVFDEGHPEQDEQGGRVFEARTLSGDVRRVELAFREGALNLAAIATGSLVWKTDDPAFRRRIEQTYARDCTPRPVPITVCVAGRIGGPLLV